MTGLCGSIIEMHSLLEKRFHQGGKKKISFDGLGRWISGGLHKAKTE